METTTSSEHGLVDVDGISTNVANISGISDDVANVDRSRKTATTPTSDLHQQSGTVPVVEEWDGQVSGSEEKDKSIYYMETSGKLIRSRADSSELIEAERNTDEDEVNVDGVMKSSNELGRRI